MPYRIDATLCPQNHACPMMKYCPVEAITQQGFALPVIDEQKCIECGRCEEVCGKRAVYQES